jgi:hypothetical protein
MNRKAFAHYLVNRAARRLKEMEGTGRKQELINDFMRRGRMNPELKFLLDQKKNPATRPPE